jgi:hypothetical protein
MTVLNVETVKEALRNDCWVVADPSGGTYAYTVDVGGKKTIMCSLVQRGEVFFALSYRWKCARCSLSGKHVPYTFIDYVNGLHPDKKVWVDFLNHLGDAECTQIVVARMAEVYERNEVLAMYMDPDVKMNANQRFLEAMRGWMWQEISVNMGIKTCVTTLGKMIRNVFKWNAVHDGCGISPDVWRRSEFRVWCEIVSIYKCTAPHNLNPCMYQAWFGYASEALHLKGAALLEDIGDVAQYNEWLDDFDSRNDPRRLLWGAISNLKSVHFTDVEDCVVASMSALNHRFGGIDLAQSETLLEIWEDLCLSTGDIIQLDLASGARALADSFGKLLGHLDCELTYWKLGSAPQDIIDTLRSEGADLKSARAVFRLTCGDGVAQHGVGQIEKLHGATPYREVTAEQPDTASTRDVRYCVALQRAGAAGPGGGAGLLYRVWPNADAGGGLRWMNGMSIVLRRDGNRFLRSPQDPRYAGSDSSALCELGRG